MIKGERIYFIDFQDARLGPPQYDLVSLVHDSYVQLSDENAQKLIDYYLEQFPEALKMFKDKKDFMHFFHLQMLQRCFKACGTFAAVLNQRGDKRYLKYLPHTLKKVNAALAELKDYPTIAGMVKNLKLPQIEKWP
jgi:aminoglycoside/choline kinase family phosphotransferase